MALKRLFIGAAGGVVAGASLVEARYRRQPGNAVAYLDDDWGSERKAPEHLRLGGKVRVRNLIPDREVMLCDIRPRVRLLSSGSVRELRCDVQLLSHESDYPTRTDEYWTACVVKPGRYERDTCFEVVVDVVGPAPALDELYAVHVSLRVDTYGFCGTQVQVHHIVLPTRFPDPADSPDWRAVSGAAVQVKPVRTHLLGPFDHPVDVVRRYATPHGRPGDIVVIGESPLAVMQRRFLDPTTMSPGWFATRSAQFMSGVGSLGTAPGMQALVDEVGHGRVLAGLVVGAAAKLGDAAGWFYRVAGAGAKLVDDVTGTLPPYDKFIVLGPADSSRVCNDIKAATGLEAAVVDANDLGNVDVLAATPAVDRRLVETALRTNPAGNADQTTPLVLIRPA
jgi:hypothetical protein